MSPEAGVIKHYQIVSCLGQGGFGKVFEAWDSKLQRSVAIKCLSADGLLSPATDLLREARMAASLNHPAFVKIHALEDGDNSQAIVMELVKGETLKQVIANKKPDLLQALSIIRQLAEAMQQAHDIGLTHGDLKPSNIMLEPAGVIRILDFGLASKADAQATTSMLQQDPQGTIAYMAPERLLGAPLAPSIDVYALGVIFYELLNGQRPFADLSGLALAAALVQSSSDQWNYSAELSPPLIHLIRRMTAKQAVQRLSSMAEVLKQIDELEKHWLGANDPAPPSRVTAPRIIFAVGRAYLHRGMKTILSRLSIGLICVLIASAAGLVLIDKLLVNETGIEQPHSLQNAMAALMQWYRPGSLDDAVQQFSGLIQRNPNSAAAIAGLSLAYSFRYVGDEVDPAWQQKAMAGAQRAVQLDSHLALAHIALGRAYYAQHKWELALAAYDKAMILDGQNVLAWHGKISVLIDSQRYDEAQDLIGNGLKQFPQEQMLLLQRGLFYAAQGKYIEAEQAFQTCIKTHPDSMYAYANLSGVLIYQGRTEEAKHLIQQGLQIRPSDYLYTNLGNIYFYEGDYLNALAAFEAAIAPELGNAGDYVSWANLADVLRLIPGRELEAEKYYAKAFQLLEPIVLRQPDNAQLVSRLALYSVRMGKLEQAGRLLNTLSLEGDADPTLNFRVGLIYELIGKRQLALEQLAIAYSQGYPLSLIEAEPDLASLRRDSDYRLH